MISIATLARFALAAVLEQDVSIHVLLGAGIGIALLSKYHAVLFVAGLLLWCARARADTGDEGGSGRVCRRILSRRKRPGGASGAGTLGVATDRRARQPPSRATWW